MNLYRKVNDGAFGWRALRLMARRSPHFFTHSNNNIYKLPEYLETMIKKIAKDRPNVNAVSIFDTESCFSDLGLELTYKVVGRLHNPKHWLWRHLATAAKTAGLLDDSAFPPSFLLSRFHRPFTKQFFFFVLSVPRFTSFRQISCNLKKMGSWICKASNRLLARLTLFTANFRKCKLFPQRKGWKLSKQAKTFTVFSVPWKNFFNALLVGGGLGTRKRRGRRELGITSRNSPSVDPLFTVGL